MQSVTYCLSYRHVENLSFLFQPLNNSVGHCNNCNNTYNQSMITNSSNCISTEVTEYTLLKKKKHVKKILYVLYTMHTSNVLAMKGVTQLDYSRYENTHSAISLAC